MRSGRGSYDGSMTSVPGRSCCLVRYASGGKYPVEEIEAYDLEIGVLGG